MAAENAVIILLLSIASCAISFLSGAFYWEIRLAHRPKPDFHMGLRLDPEFWRRGSPKCPFSSDEQLEEYRRQYEIRAAKRIAWSKEKENNS